MRLLAVVYGLLSVLLAVVSVPLAVIAPLGLDLQGSALDRLAAQILFASPLLLLGGAIAAVFVFRRPGAVRGIVMLLPLVPVVFAAALAASR